MGESRGTSLNVHLNRGERREPCMLGMRHNCRRTGIV